MYKEVPSSSLHPQSVDQPLPGYDLSTCYTLCLLQLGFLSWFPITCFSHAVTPQEYPANLGCFRKPKGFGFVFCHVFCPMCSAMEVWLKPLEFPLRPSVTRARRFFSGQRAMVSKLGTGVPDVKQAMSVGIILGDFAFIVPCHVLGKITLCSRIIGTSGQLSGLSPSQGYCGKCRGEIPPPPMLYQASLSPGTLI